MIVVHIDLWPSGFPDFKEKLGIIDIINNRTGSKSRGNYDVILYNYDKKTGRPKIYKSKKIKNFPRLKRSKWALLYEALNAVYGKKK